MVVSEIAPFAKTGGLADVAAALPLALSSLGFDLHLFMPRYTCVKEKGPSVQVTKGVEIHFIDHEGYFGRKGIYGESNGDYPDNLDRFSFFCRETLRRMKEAGIRPDILHAHDWQAALSIALLSKQLHLDPFFSRTRSIFTVHNLAYQGIFPREQFPRLELPWELFTIDGLEFYDKVNLLKGGLMFADRLTTVSPTYAQEIQTQEQGEGLDGVLRMRSKELVGILNGIDVRLWNPATDKALAFPYDSKEIKLKEKNKAALQKEVGLEVSLKPMLIGMVTRLASQKGLGLVGEALDSLKGLDLQLVILGSGDRAVSQALTRAALGAKKIRVVISFNEALAHRIYGGCDAFLMPSRYEPCGLGQMIAMRYGTVPIVRSTGGLNDTVTEDRKNPEEGNGFSFQPYRSEALVGAIQRALRVYQDPPGWRRIVEKGMNTDFSWDRSARDYAKLYESLLS